MKQYSRHVPFEDILPPCTAADVKTLESYYGLPLPNDYREFLLQHNGVLFEGYAIFKILEPSSNMTNYGVINALRGISEPLDELDLRHWLYRDGCDFKDRVPDHIKVIGTSLVNNYLTISLGPDDTGCVYLWDPGLDWEYRQNYRKDYSNLELAGHSFSSWWGSLQHRPRAGFSLESGEYETKDAK